MANESNCPICDAELSRPLHPTRDIYFYVCPSCGEFGIGDHTLGGDDKIEVQGNLRIQLKHLMCERRVRKQSPAILVMHEETVQRPNDKFVVMNPLTFIEQSYPKSYLEYFDRALENVSLLLNHPVANLDLLPINRACLFSEGDGQISMMQKLRGLGYITFEYMGLGDTASYGLTPDGWKRVAEIQRPGRDAKQAFVAMWFNPSHEPYFVDGIKPAIEWDGKTKAMRIDLKAHNNKIDDEIIAEIRRSRFLVADFTAHRGGVYFEAGFALGLNLPVIWTVHDSHLKDSHFDTRQYNHITYSTPVELRDKLTNRIRATIV